eukprot:gnl/TRDRNA2_/TRDRNA2_127935_c0_seq1.p1 gnl/TRDRNA2_/TRDRNA2_127935_c0~~gnl/TRDRNA2_/TRDRNA2_127935_c0_seq1.p1  ORF type:complete len:258 (+),score=54.81 gnl/TRDRNA2_/TRDRNA2_127935_c0_seq1:87-776(+)
MFGSQSCRTWICSAQVSELVGNVDEEIMGDESPAYKPHIQNDDSPVAKLAQQQSPLKKVPDRPVGGPGAPQDDKVTAKTRLQQLIRDFAHEAVGPGVEVAAESAMLAGRVQGVLRMDRRLSRIEVWPPADGAKKASPMCQVPLGKVCQISKDVSRQNGEQPAPDIDSCTLVVLQLSGIELRLIFDSTGTRDRAYACLRVFQKSVEQSPPDGNSVDDESSVKESLRETTA